jgi:hypothetical protein
MLAKNWLRASKAHAYLGDIKIEAIYALHTADSYAW